MMLLQMKIWKAVLIKIYCSKFLKQFEFKLSELNTETLIFN